MAARITQVAIEIGGVPVPAARITRVALEVAGVSPINQTRLTQVALEVGSTRQQSETQITTERLVFVAAILAATDNMGGMLTSYATNGPGWTTKTTDTPDNTEIKPRLQNPGTYRRELFSGNKTFGAVRPSFGEAVLNNADGHYDAWKDYGLDARAYTVYAGPHRGAFPADFDVVFSCVVESAIVGFDVVRLKLTDNLKLLDKPILTDLYLGTGELEGPEEMEGTPKWRIFGDPVYTPVQPVVQVAPELKYTTTGPTYDIAASYEGTIPANEVVLRYKFPREVTFVVGLAPSKGQAEDTATSSRTFTIYKNSAGTITSVGTMVFAAATEAASFSMATETVFEVDDVMTVAAPGTSDATLAGIAFTISGYV